MTTRYELLHFIGEDSPEANAFIDRFTADVLRNAASVAENIAAVQDEHCAPAVRAVAAELHRMAQAVTP